MSHTMFEVGSKVVCLRNWMVANEMALKGKTYVVKAVVGSSLRFIGFNEKFPSKFFELDDDSDLRGDSTK